MTDTSIEELTHIFNLPEFEDGCSRCENPAVLACVWKCTIDSKTNTKNYCLSCWDSYLKSSRGRAWPDGQRRSHSAKGLCPSSHRYLVYRYWPIK